MVKSLPSDDDNKDAAENENGCISINESANARSVIPSAFNSRIFNLPLCPIDLGKSSTILRS